MKQITNMDKSELKPYVKLYKKKIRKHDEEIKQSIRDRRKILGISEWVFTREDV